VRKTVVINAVGLTQRLLSPHQTPRMAAFAAAGRVTSISPVIPAVTCSVQSTYLTGSMPREHGIVGNGWYFRDECEIKFWRQSNPLVNGAKVWDVAKQRDPNFTCANVCWWYAMYSSADYTVTPRPMYPADGRKLPDCWTDPPELRHRLQGQLGQFPLFQFWGPATSIRATEWIAHAAMHLYEKHSPTLTLVYLPHLDYGLQKYGPDPRHPRNAADLLELDSVVGQLLDYFAAQDQPRVMIISEYGIAPVSRPVHLNRVLREHQLITYRTELGREMLDPGASVAFAVADHQVAHVYVNDASQLNRVRALLENTPGVARVLDEAGKREIQLDHERAGDLVALAEPDAWFTYYYWLDDARAPDFARTVDIHRKPGYDPVELFLDPKLPAPKLKIAATLAKRKLGFRATMDVIGLDATLVKGSHGLAPPDPADGAMVASSDAELLPHDGRPVPATDVFKLILRHLDLA
jgi:predicted AlkP superfamily pyrophosphatase or phosphodiesterase